MLNYFHTHSLLKDLSTTYYSDHIQQLVKSAPGHSGWQNEGNRELLDLQYSRGVQ